MEVTMNKVILKGRLAQDPESKKSKNKKEYTVYTIAVQRYNQDEVDFIPCISWDKNAEFVSKYFTKGKEILIAGRIKVVKDGDKTNTFVEVDSVEFCGKKED